MRAHGGAVPSVDVVHPLKNASLPKARRRRAALGRILASMGILSLAACGTLGQQRDGIRDPDAASRMRVAMAAEASGQQDVAISMFAAAASAAPSDLEAQSRYAAALGRAGMMPEAEQVLTRALQQSPRDPRLLLALGQVRVRTGAANEALALFDQVLAQSPRSVAAMNGRSVALDLLGRHGEAQQGYRAAQALEPANIASANNLAMSLMLEGRSGEAVAILNALRQRSGVPPRVTNNLGIAQAASGDAQSARATLAGRVDDEDVGRIIESLRPTGIPPTSTLRTEPLPEPTAAREPAIVATPVRVAAGPVSPRLALLVSSTAPEPAPAAAPVQDAEPYIPPVSVAAPSPPPPPVVAAPSPASAPPVTVRAVVVPVPIPAAALSVEQPTPPAAPLPDNATAGLGAFQVQIAALGSDAEAQRLWDVVSARHAGIIEGRDRIIIRADRGDRIVYRLRMGGFANSAEATLFCARLRAASQACFASAS